ncbi:chromosomal replication initiator protein DnaA [Butyrivibrio sp. MC2013]|uniref:chromosomal replication initiator protein DnaA n=1 Tax=Butyrivibrio sp. MC2013 TaxID=1280686 RepID=UPI00040B96CB|nr:chromosomal replication initiator protein DnaA [Butyrivibrio sp. MC2013]
MSSDEITNALTMGWDHIKGKVREDSGITDISYNTWIDPLVFHAFKGNCVEILIPQDNTIAQNYISSHYLNFFKVAISELIGSVVDVSFLLQKDVTINYEETPSHDTDKIRETAENSYENSNLNPKYRFDTFVVGNNNKFAHSAALAVADFPGENYNPLFLYGGPGLGKTHLMHSIGHYIMEHNSAAKVLYVTSEQFTNEVIESIRSGKQESMSRLREKYRKVDVLMVDDVQFIIGKESTQEEFFHTFNELHQAGKQIILSSDRPPKEMETLEERFRSRFEMGLIADIQAPDYETRMAILRKNAENFGGHFGDDILEYIANNIKSNIRELEGAFNKIIAYSRLNNVDITLDNAKNALRDIISPDTSKIITPSLIINTVCEQYDVRIDDVISKKRNSEIVTPRQIIMYLCREMTDSSLEEIGRTLGKKDHTTVMSGISRIKEKLSQDEELVKNVDIIKKKLGSGN